MRRVDVSGRQPGATDAAQRVKGASCNGVVRRVQLRAERRSQLVVRDPACVLGELVLVAVLWPLVRSEHVPARPLPIPVRERGVRERPRELGPRVARAEVVGVGLEVRQGLGHGIGVLAGSKASANVVQPVLQLTWFRQAHLLILSDRVRDGGEAYCPRMFIADIPEEAASPEMAAMFAADRDHHGYVNNWTKVYARRPDVLAAWSTLRDAIASRMDQRRYELVTMAAAQRMRSSYCALAHGVGLIKHFYDADTVLHLASDRENAGVDEVDLAVMRFAEKVVDDASQITQADVDRLRDLGLDDDDVIDVALAAAARCFFSKVLDAVGAQPDSAYLRLDEKLRDVLTVGRPISPD